MKEDATYQELKIQITQLQKQNKEHCLNFSIQSEEKEKCASELFKATSKLEQQSKENEKLEEDLTTANLAVALQSELILAKEKAEYSLSQLKELNATKDKLFSIIAHDLLNPIGNILNLSELLIESVNKNDSEETQEFLNFIIISAKDTLVILGNLLNWAKSQTGQINFKPKNLVLSSIIQNAIDVSKSQAKSKNISLNFKNPYHTEVYADENMLETVLRNLISNAIKFTRPNGEIIIATTKDNDQIEISISDNGVGMDDETLKNMFNINANMTSVGTANETGSGLGLVLCKEFVERLGGSIWAESEKGKGSDFKFTLPL